MIASQSPGRLARRHAFLIWATAILLLAAMMRLVALADIPPGLAQDEVLDADIAAFIRAGEQAFFFRHGYGHEPLYHYLATPFAPLLGDNILAVRLPSIILGLLLVALAMRWARREFGHWSALVTGVGLAISWWPIIFSRLGIRPVLEPVLLLLMAWTWPRRPWLAGFWLGLAVYSYTGARVVYVIPILLALAALLNRQRPSQVGWRQPARMLLVALLVSLPMLLTLWADPSLQQRVDQLAGPLTALRAGDFGPIWDSIWRTLGVASFTGDPRSTYTLPDRPLFEAFTAIFFYAGLLLALWRWRQPRYQLLLSWLLVGLIPSAVTPQAPSTVRLIGILPLVYLLPGLALDWLAAQRYQPGRRPVTTRQLKLLWHTLLIGLFLLNVGRTMRDGFVRWPAMPAVRLDHYQAVWLAISRQYRIDPVTPVLADSFFEPIDHDSLRRSVGAPLPARWVQGGSALVLPAETPARLYVPEYAALDAHLLALAGLSPEPVYRDAGYPSFAVYDLPARWAAPAGAQPVTFGAALTYLGSVTLSSEDNQAPVYTYWRVETPLPADLALFLHRLDDNGVILTQHDGLDAVPQFLQPGDLFLQRHTFPTDLPASDTTSTLRLGVYERNSGARWPVNSSPVADFLFITPESR